MSPRYGKARLVTGCPGGKQLSENSESFFFFVFSFFFPHSSQALAWWSTLQTKDRWVFRIILLELKHPSSLEVRIYANTWPSRPGLQVIWVPWVAAKRAGGCRSLSCSQAEFLTPVGAVTGPGGAAGLTDALLISVYVNVWGCTMLEHSQPQGSDSC